MDYFYFLIFVFGVVTVEAMFARVVFTYDVDRDDGCLRALWPPYHEHRLFRRRTCYSAFLLNLSRFAFNRLAERLT